MAKKSMTILFLFLVFSQLFDEQAEAADFYSYIPFLYKIPEGSVGVFKNGNQFYDDIYPAGVYTVWPSDEGFNISILPEKVTVTEISCITVEKIKITFPAMTVHYQVNEENVFELVKNRGFDFVKPLIKNPLRQGVADLCSTMTAESVYLEQFSILQQYISDYLAEVQVDKESGLLVIDVDINRPHVPDEMLENFIGRNLPTGSCDQPYEIFYTLEDEKEARERLCGADQQTPIVEDDLSREKHGLMMPVEPLTVSTTSMETHQDNSRQPGYELPSEEGEHRLIMDPFIDDEDSFDEEADTEETSRHQVGDDLKGGKKHVESVYSAGVEIEKYPTQPIQSNVESYQDERKRNLHQQMQHSKGLWKNNNSRLYLGW
ncbi:SPFH domain-containing protein [Endozoicomonas elysicola]|nr:SPFH domain-containing protein [Endozoicomonas elysicola]